MHRYWISIIFGWWSVTRFFNIFISLTILFFLVPFVSATIEDKEILNEYGWYLFDSHPQGEVIFDSISYGNTPVYVKVDCNNDTSYEVIIRIEGYEEYSRLLTEKPEPGQIVPINLHTNLILNIRNFLSEETSSN